MILVYGLGRSGLGVLRFLARRNLAACFHDDRPAVEDLATARALGFEPCAPEPGRFATVVAAPGVPIDHPNLVALERGGAEVIGEAELAWRHTALPLVGVTGTAGKTTTTVFTAELLRRAGVAAEAAGNIDPPLVEVVDRPGVELAVVELSSFQLERVRTFRPRVAVLLNLGTDHLDRHGSLERYHAAKLRLLENLTEEDVLVYNAADPRVARAAQAARAQRVPFKPGPDPRTTNARAAARAAEAALRLLGRPAPTDLEAQALSLPAVPGRFEAVGRVGGALLIDDSIATRTEAVAAALAAAPAPVAWIAGGVDKGAELEPLVPLVRERVALLLAIGRDGPRFARAFAPHTRTVIIDEAEGGRALEQALARALAEDVASVLLAPLAASFDQFANYKERSRAFRDAARRVGGAAWTAS
ncbi:Mur ligase family protein [Oceanithermus sp.]|uniref:Mur ligase family protein n=1 Tax=Oceanithermus sp. TaxID=2268145 RepID=UPI0025E12121|nr:Mur ligase family protein [Oceanithermus sp.]